MCRKGFVPHLRRSVSIPSFIPALRPGLRADAPSGLATRRNWSFATETRLAQIIVRSQGQPRKAVRHSCRKLKMQSIPDLPASDGRCQGCATPGHRPRPGHAQTRRVSSVSTSLQRKTSFSKTYSSVLCRPFPPGPKMTDGIPACPRTAASVQKDAPPRRGACPHFLRDSSSAGIK